MTALRTPCILLPPSAAALSACNGHLAMVRWLGDAQSHDDVFVSVFDNPPWRRSKIRRVLARGAFKAWRRLAFTTDSYVVDPLFFQRDIGNSRLCTINDWRLAGYSALPHLQRIIESLEVDTLRGCEIDGIGRRCGVSIVTGTPRLCTRALRQAFPQYAGWDYPGRVTCATAAACMLSSSTASSAIMAQRSHARGTCALDSDRE